jgi:regulator of replication initiation timing
MIKWLRNLIALPARFEDLQKSHDLRAVLNGRLSAENDRLRKELSHRKPGVKLNVQKHIDKMVGHATEKNALLQIENQRQTIVTDLLRDFVSEAQFKAICDEVKALTDEQVMAYQKPKKRA